LQGGQKGRRATQKKKRQKTRGAEVDAPKTGSKKTLHKKTNSIGELQPPNKAMCPNTWIGAKTPEGRARENTFGETKKNPGGTQKKRRKWRRGGESWPTRPTDSPGKPDQKHLRGPELTTKKVETSSNSPRDKTAQSYNFN